MRTKLVTQSLVVVFLLVSLLSCSSDDDGGAAGSAANGTITAKVDGANFQSNEMLSMATKVSAGATTTLTLQGTDNTGKGFNFGINGYEGEGSYEIGGNNLVFVVASYVEGNASNPTATQTWTAPYDNTSLRGSISIVSETDDKVEGTFEFTCKNPNDGSVKTISDGSFNLEISNF